MEQFELLIDGRSKAPIYDQIYTQIKAAIVSGQLKEEDALPSIRSLAKDLRISVITTKRAYEELEREGYIYMVGGKGCFVAPKDTKRIREENLMKIEQYFETICALARECALTQEDLKEMLADSMQGSRIPPA